MMNNIPAISNWNRIFIDTSFIIDSVRDLSSINNSDPKYTTILKTHKLLDTLNNFKPDDKTKITWVTSSIVLSELTKFESKDAVDKIQKILKSSNIEIINFTRKEANIILNDFQNYIEDKHIAQYLNELKKDISKLDIYSPKNVISNDTLIIACAKSKLNDVVLTSDKNSFLPIALKVNLPVLCTENLPIDMFQNIDIANEIKI